MAVGTTVAKTTLAVGPETTFYQPANTVYTGVAANAWKLISELQSLPDIGDGERETVTYTSIDKGIVNKLKGTLDYGEGDIVALQLSGDAGQDAMAAAMNSDKPSLFKLTLPTGAYRYFTANVMSAKASFGEANDMIKITYKVAITHSGPLVAPAP